MKHDAGNKTETDMHATILFHSVPEELGVGAVFKR